MPPSDRLRDDLITRYGDVDTFLANFPSPNQTKLGRTFAPLLRLMQDSGETLPVRRSATRAGLDLATRNPGLRIEEAQVMALLSDRKGDPEIRLNCGLMLLFRPKGERSRVLDEIEGLKQASDQWVAAIARVLLRSERNGETTPEMQLLAIADGCKEEEIAAALFLLQLHGSSERAWNTAIARTRHSNPRVRITAARLSLIQAILRVTEIGHRMADVFLPLASDADARVRSVVPTLLALFVSNSLTVQGLTRTIEADDDPIVIEAMQRRWIVGRFCEFPELPRATEPA